MASSSNRLRHPITFHQKTHWFISNHTALNKKARFKVTTGAKNVAVERSIGGRPTWVRVKK